jgi:hypothetical protein
MNTYMLLGCGMVDDADWAAFWSADYSVMPLCGTSTCIEPYHLLITNHAETHDRHSCRRSSSARDHCMGHATAVDCIVDAPDLLFPATRLAYYKTAFEALEDAMWYCPYTLGVDPEVDCDYVLYCYYR